MAGRVTIGDVAARAGVSKTAVSKVLNGTGSISAATTARILTAADELHWQPSAQAVGLRQARARTVALIMSRVEGRAKLSATTADLITGIEGVLSLHGYGLLLQVIDDDPAEEERTYRQLTAARRIDGAVLIDSRVDDQRFALLRAIGLPAVLVGTPQADADIPHVRTDPGPAMEEAIDHLAGLGHRGFGYVGGPSDLIQPQLRREAFERAVRARRLRRVAVVSGPYSAEVSEATTLRLLRRKHRPTALLYGTDSMALAGISAAFRLGLSVPEDVSVIGYEGSPVGAWTRPALTTIQRNVARRGEVAAELLLGQLGVDVPGTSWSGDEQLLVRESTGPAPR